jgi:FAD/FMN-containing dehydrogenase
MTAADITERSLQRGAPGYEDARRAAVWNGRKPDRYPEAIVIAESEDDVVAAVRLARETGLRLSVRSGGHNFFGASVREGGLLLDLSRLDALSVDAGAGTASLQPAVRSGQLAAALRKHDLAFPIGHCDTVAAGGYLLAGGLGWNVGAWGPACFSVTAIEVVTAAGELVTADANQNEDLYWLARGSGAGFPGVVTRYHVDAFPHPPAIVASTYVYPPEAVGEISEWVAETRSLLPHWVELALALVPAPHGSGHVAVVTAAAFAESSSDATAALGVLESCPARASALHGETDEPSGFGALLDGFSALFPVGLRFQADTLWSSSGLGEVVARAAPHLADAAPRSFLLAVPIGAPPEGAPHVDAAFSMVDRTLFLSYAIWEREEDDAANLAWSQSLVADVEPLASGFYIGETDLPAGEDRGRRCFADANWARITALRAAADPDGIFQPLPGPDGFA